MECYDKKTICPNCNNKCSIAENRAHQIKRNYAPFWFFDAIKQFEKYNEVKCSSRGHTFIAKEARLFHYFKSPYTVVVFCLLFLLMALVLTFKLKACNV